MECLRSVLAIVVDRRWAQWVGKLLPGNVASRWLGVGAICTTKEKW